MWPKGFDAEPEPVSFWAMSMSGTFHGQGGMAGKTFKEEKGSHVTSILPWHYLIVLLVFPRHPIYSQPPITKITHTASHDSLSVLPFGAEDTSFRGRDSVAPKMKP